MSSCWTCCVFFARLPGLKRSRDFLHVSNCLLKQARVFSALKKVVCLQPVDPTEYQNEWLGDVVKTPLPLPLTLSLSPSISRTYFPCSHARITSFCLLHSKLRLHTLTPGILILADQHLLGADSHTRRRYSRPLQKKSAQWGGMDSNVNTTKPSQKRVGAGLALGMWHVKQMKCF